MNIDLNTAKSFFMWCTILNGGLLVISSMMIVFANDWVYRIQSRWVPISRDAFNTAIYCFLGVMKLIVITCNLAPYVALVIIS